MESSKVRMHISRDMHDWFKAIDAKTNDERMKRVIEFNDDYKQLLIENNRLEKSLAASREVSSEFIEKTVNLKSESVTLKAMLALSTAVSIVSVSSLAYVQGWFL